MHYLEVIGELHRGSKRIVGPNFNTTPVYAMIFEEGSGHTPGFSYSIRVEPTYPSGTSLDPKTASMAISDFIRLPIEDNQIQTLSSSFETFPLNIAIGKAIKSKDELKLVRDFFERVPCHEKIDKGLITEFWYIDRKKAQ